MKKKCEKTPCSLKNIEIETDKDKCVACGSDLVSPASLFANIFGKSIFDV